MPLATQAPEKILPTPRPHNGIDGNGANLSGSRAVLRRLTFPILVTYALIPLLSLTETMRKSRFELDSSFAVWAYHVAETGGPAGASGIGLLLLLLLVTRAGISAKRRLIEAGAIFSCVAILGGGGAALNEYVIKPAFEIPRPNLVHLAGANGSGPLGMRVNEFYALGDKATRRRQLRAVLDADRPAIRLHHLIREHWIDETGYSFPSGHAFSAMFFATFFFAMGVNWLVMPRLLFFYLLLPWAVCVCYSRIILQMHTAADVSVGGLAGLLLGALAFVLVRASITAIIHKALTPADR